MKEVKRLILPGLCSRLLRSRESARNREIDRERERERETDRQTDRQKERQTDTGTKALLEQSCFNQQGVGIYKVVILNKDKN